MIGSRRTPSPRRDHHRLGTPAWDLAHDSFAEQRETWSPRTLTDRHNLELRRLAEQHAEDQGRLRAELDESRKGKCSRSLCVFFRRSSKPRLHSDASARS